MVPMVWPSLLSDLDADQLLARQVLARRLALEEGVGRDRDLGGLLLGLLLLLRQGGYGKRGGEKESESESVHGHSLRGSRSAAVCDSGAAARATSACGTSQAANSAGNSGLGATPPRMPEQHRRMLLITY